MILSDAHVTPLGGPLVHGIDTNARLAMAVERVSQLRPKMEFVVHLGDLTNDPSLEAYCEFSRITRGLRTQQFYVWGNHDDGGMLSQELPPPVDVDPTGVSEGYYRFSTGGVQGIVLNSNGPVPAGGGDVDAVQLEWLENVLVASNSSPSLVFVHHPMHKIGIDWLDSSGLHNSGDLLEVLSRHSQVLRVFSGHVHRRSWARPSGVPSETVRSTAFSLGPRQADAVANSGQGFVVVEVNGAIVGTTDFLV